MIDSYTFFKDKKILIVGLGMTGISAASMITRLGGKVFATDNNTTLERDDIYKKIINKTNEKAKEKIPEGLLEIIIDQDANNKISLLEDISLVIVSPGVPGNIPLLEEACKRGIDLWDEIELAWSLMTAFQKKNTIAVTGTNGKTTVVNLIQKILSDAKFVSAACGNVGFPLIDTLQLASDHKIMGDKMIRVIEVSSFQLERTKTFKPHIGVLLNITSDHMDRHGDIQDYGRLKFNLFSNQDKDDIAVLNMDDKFIAENLSCIKEEENTPEIIKFGLQSSSEHNFLYENEIIFFDFKKYKGNIDIGRAELQGVHNVSNIMASVISALLVGVSPESIEKSVIEFKPLDHRIEYLGVVAGIRCFNDSKSTNPDSTLAALRDFGKEVTLILGGKDKDMDFLMLAKIIDEKVKDLILIGQAAPRIMKIFGPLQRSYKIHSLGSLEEAVKLSFKVTKPGEVLILSPACASMDMFKDYRDRGERFKKLVLSYGKR